MLTYHLQIIYKFILCLVTEYFINNETILNDF